jgi:hypothetical protein
MNSFPREVDACTAARHVLPLRDTADCTAKN